MKFKKGDKVKIIKSLMYPNKTPSEYYKNQIGKIGIIQEVNIIYDIPYKITGVDGPWWDPELILVSTSKSNNLVKIVMAKTKPKEVYLLKYDKTGCGDPVEEFKTLSAAQKRVEVLIDSAEAELSSMILYKAVPIGKPRIEFEIIK